MHVPRKTWLSLGALAAVAAAAAGISYAAIPDGQVQFHACMLNATGSVRLIDPSLPSSNLRSHCTQLESAVTWNQQGPPGNTDSTVRHRRAPSASLACRRSFGTSFSISSLERMTIGSISAASASEPAKPE